MRLHTGISKSRKSSTAIGIAMAASTLSACAMNQQASLSPLGPPPYLALAQGGTNFDSDLRRSGSFAEQQGCIVFQPADNSPAVTPVFPKGETDLVTDGQQWLGLYVKGAPVVLDETYRVSAAEYLPSGAVALAAPLAAGCPKTVIRVETVGEVLADADIGRFCNGVTLCMAFKLE